MYIKIPATMQAGANIYQNIAFSFNVYLKSTPEGVLFCIINDIDYLDSLIAAWAAASLAIGTRKGEQET